MVQREDSEDFKVGFDDGAKGRPKLGVPRAGEALADYDRGYAKGLDDRLDKARQVSNWQVIAEVLNAFNIDDIFARIANMSGLDLTKVEEGAWQNPKVGKDSQIAHTVHDVIAALDPTYYAPGAVFPNNFGDNLGPVGGAVIAAAGGLLALRLAIPLLAGYWRTIQISLGMAKVAAEVDKEDAELAEMEVGAAVERLMNGPGGRILVSYQSAAPAADRELYLTTREGVQYAEAVSAGRNLYQLRIPDRLFSLLEQRQLIEVRQGSMGNQVGDDIRISAGAMEFLAKYIKEVPLK